MVAGGAARRGLGWATALALLFLARVLASEASRPPGLAEYEAALAEDSERIARFDLQAAEPLSDEADSLRVRLPESWLSGAPTPGRRGEALLGFVDGQRIPLFRREPQRWPRGAFAYRLSPRGRSVVFRCPPDRTCREAAVVRAAPVFRLWLHARRAAAHPSVTVLATATSALWILVGVRLARTRPAAWSLAASSAGLTLAALLAAGTGVGTPGLAGTVVLEAAALAATVAGPRISGFLAGAKRAVEATVVLLLFAVAFGEGRSYVGAFGRSNQPFFYQSYYEPAVLLACGHGFRSSVGTQALVPRHPPLADFLRLKRDRFACEELPQDLTLRPEPPVQTPWFYMLSTVGLYWKLTGISWSGLGGLLGVLFGLSVVAVYALARLAMGRTLSVIVSLLFAASSLHLENLPHLRDYSKAPFILWSLLAVAWLATRRVRPKSLLALAAAYGAMLGVGYGFRADVLIAAPVFVLAVTAFLPMPLRSRLRLKAAALGLFALAFVIAAWPVLSYVWQRGGCQWHFLMLGLQEPFSQRLGVTPTFYDWGAFNFDQYVDAHATSHALRVFGVSPLVYCSPEYDRVTRDLFLRIAALFPADLATRALASVLRLPELAFSVPGPPIGVGPLPVFELRRRFVELLAGSGTAAVALAVLWIGARRVRLGLFALVGVLYFGGYPALQFEPRHHFHLEFFTWWALGLLVQAAWTSLPGLPSLWRRPSVLRHLQARARRAGFAAVLFALAIAVPGAALVALRAYQDRSVAELVRAYLTAPRRRLDVSSRPRGEAVLLADLRSPAALSAEQVATGEILMVELGEPVCRDRDVGLTFRFDPGSRLDISRSFRASGGDGPARPARVFYPALYKYSALLGIEVSAADAPCVTGVYRVTDLARIPLLVSMNLPPRWEESPHHQSVRRR